MNDNKLLQYMTTSLKDKNKAIKELTEDNKKYKKIIEITTLLLILSIVGNVFMIFLLNH